jgi:hypothetical protein
LGRSKGARDCREVPEGAPTQLPIVLTLENEIPRPYQIGIFPTYIVIDRDGAIAAAQQGGRGFAGLRQVLNKAGLEIE